MKRATTSDGFTVEQKQFFEFLKNKHPKLYGVAMKVAKRETAAQGLAGMGDIDWPGIFSKVTDAVSAAAPQLLQLKQQRDLMKLQLQRAKAGQPPIAPEQYAQYATPATAVSVEAPYSGLNVQTYAGGLNTKQILTYAGIALGGLALFFLLKPKR